MIARAREWMTTHPAWTVFIVALVVRVAYALRVGPVISPDSLSYHAAAAALRSSALTTDQTFIILPPAYVVFVAVLSDDRLILAAQLAMSAACSALILRAIARHAGQGAGWIAGLLAAFQPTVVFWSTYILSDTLALTLYAVALDLASLALARRRMLVSALGGAAAALLLLTRAAYGLASVPLLIAYVGMRPRLRLVAAFAAAALIVLALPTTRNAIAMGQPSIYEGQLWTNLWIGTQWTEVGRATTGVDLNPPPELATKSSAERQAYYRDVTLTFLRDRPLDYALLDLKKGLWYVLPVYPEWSAAHKIGIGGYLSALYVLAVAGAVVSRRQAFTWVLVACAASFVLTAMITYVDYDARYRLPFELTCVPLAAVGVLGLWRLLPIGTRATSLGAG